MTYDQVLGCAQASAGLTLARKLAARYWPRHRCGAGMGGSIDLFVGLWDHRHRPAFIRALQKHCIARVQARDAKRTPEQVATRYGLQWHLANDKASAV